MFVNLETITYSLIERFEDKMYGMQMSLNSITEKMIDSKTNNLGIVKSRF